MEKETLPVAAAVIVAGAVFGLVLWLELLTGWPVLRGALLVFGTLALLYVLGFLLLLFALRGNAGGTHRHSKRVR